MNLEELLLQFPNAPDHTLQYNTIKKVDLFSNLISKSKVHALLTRFAFLQHTKKYEQIVLASLCRISPIELLNIQNEVVDHLADKNIVKLSMCKWVIYKSKKTLYQKTIQLVNSGKKRVSYTWRHGAHVKCSPSSGIVDGHKSIDVVVMVDGEMENSLLMLEVPSSPRLSFVVMMVDPVFQGNNLNLTRTKLEILNGHVDIPMVFIELWHKLKLNHGMESRGIFRVSGNAKDCMQLKHLIDIQLWDDELCEYDADCYASVIKSYLREQPIAIFEDVDIQDCQRISDIVNKLEDAGNENRRDLFLWVMDIMLTVIRAQDVNGMSAHNCAIVLSPNLVAKDATVENIASTTEILTKVLQNDK